MLAFLGVPSIVDPAVEVCDLSGLIRPFSPGTTAYMVFYSVTLMLLRTLLARKPGLRASK